MTNFGAHVTPKLKLKETMPYCNLKHTTLSMQEMIDQLSLSCSSRCLYGVKMLVVSLNIIHVIEIRIRDFYPRARRRTSWPGGEGTQEIFIRGGPAPRSNPSPFYLPFLPEKGPLSYTIYCKKHCLFLEDESITYH